MALSIRLLQVGILSKRLNISRKQRRTIAQRLWCQWSWWNSNGVTPTSR